MYKVAIHPPGTTFPPNGLPVVDPVRPQRRRRPRLRQGLAPGLRSAGRRRLPGAHPRQPGSGRPAARLSADGAAAAARLPRAASAHRPAGRQGQRPADHVTAERLDEFDGEISLELDNLPPGFSAPATSILPGDNSTSFALFAEPTATRARQAGPAQADGPGDDRRQGSGARGDGRAAEADRPGDIVTTTEQSEVTIKPGGEVRVSVRDRAAQRLQGPGAAGRARPAARRARAGHRPQRHPDHGEGDDADAS